MELTKNRITTTNLKAAKYVEFTVDDDFNVPDVKGDIDRQIASKGQVTIENIDVMEGKARITGTVSYAILYQTDREGYSFESHDGELPFEETINADELSLGDKVSVQGVLEDLYVEPVFRGQGIARQLTRSAQALCRERGVGSLTVCCAPCDEAMYQALGFNVPLGVSRSCLL